MAELPTERLINELQSFGVRLADSRVGAQSRRGGAGPSDHKAVTIAGRTVMVPIHTAASHESPYTASRPDVDGVATIERDGIFVGRMTFSPAAALLCNANLRRHPLLEDRGAALEGRAGATTVLQTCIRYQSRTKTCQFCAIGQSLSAGRTIAHKTPEQLAEVARAAVLLDGVKHMVMTTGTPNAHRPWRRGAVRERLRQSELASICRSRPQCEPPDSESLVRAHEGLRYRHAGHAHRGGVAGRARAHHAGQSKRAARAVYEGVRGSRAGVWPRTGFDLHPRRPGRHVRGHPSRWPRSLWRAASYPFVVPFVPISGTPLEDHATPSPAFMHANPRAARRDAARRRDE